VPSFTRFAGLYDRATGAEPFALPQSWIAAQSKLDPQTIFDISSTNDIIGGNSGSPLLDRDGHVVGAVFDGNIHSLGGDYFYDGTTNRAVTVSATAIRAALTQVYGMDGLVSELSGQ
jgi:S1-C subfamily serine protease